MSDPGAAAKVQRLARLATRRLAALDRRLASPREAAVAVALTMVFVIALRLPVVSTRPAGGVDYGHYLATLHWLTGAEPTQFGNEGLFGYHFLLGALAFFLGEPQATVASGPLVAAFLVPASYLLARRFLPPLPALASAGLLGSMQNLSEMIAWGGNPNLLALAFSLVMWRYVLDIVATPEVAGAPRRAALLSGLFLGLTVLTHSFTALVTLVALACFMAAALGLGWVPPRSLARPGAHVAAVAVLVSLPAAPLYATLLSAGSLGGGQGSAPPWEIVTSALAYLHRDTPLLWLGAGGLSIIAAALLIRRREPFGLFLAVALAVPLLLSLTFLNPLAARTLYFLDPPLALGLVAAAWIGWDHRVQFKRVPAAVRRPAVAAIAIAFLLLVPVTSVERETKAVEFYNHLSVDHLAALEWLREHSTRADAAWTDGSTDFDPGGRAGQLYGFWIEGYARRPSLYTARPEDLAFDYQQAAARDACRVFQGDRGAENGLLRVGVGGSLQVPIQPTIAIASGLDYQIVVSGGDLGLEAGALIYRLSDGVLGSNQTANISAERASFESTAVFEASNNWSGNASARLELAGGAVSYRIDAEGQTNALPWIHKAFVVSPRALLLGTDGTNLSSVQSVHYLLPESDMAAAARFTLAFSAPDPLSNLTVRVHSFPFVNVVDVVVSGRAQSPSLVTQFQWEDPPAALAAGGPVRFFEASAILAEYHVRFLFVETVQTDLARRFDSQTPNYRRAFEDAAIIIFEVSPAQ